MVTDISVQLGYWSASDLTEVSLMPGIKNINHLHSLQMGSICLCWSMPSTISWAIYKFADTSPACMEPNCEPEVRD